jgi:hypothetical protein
MSLKIVHSAVSEKDCTIEILKNRFIENETKRQVKRLQKKGLIKQTKQENGNSPESA